MGGLPKSVEGGWEELTVLFGLGKRSSDFHKTL